MVYVASLKKHRSSVRTFRISRTNYVPIVETRAIKTKRVTTGMNADNVVKTKRETGVSTIRDVFKSEFLNFPGLQSPIINIFYCVGSFCKRPATWPNSNGKGSGENLSFYHADRRLR